MILYYEIPKNFLTKHCNISPNSIISFLFWEKNFKHNISKKTFNSLFTGIAYIQVDLKERRFALISDEAYLDANAPIFEDFVRFRNEIDCWDFGIVREEIEPTIF